MWGATCHRAKSHHNKSISIHAPRVGSDRLLREITTYRDNFNPRSPCGERQQQCRQKRRRKKFQSTLPVWGATTHHRMTPERHQISIHAPRVGSDRLVDWSCCRAIYFNPRSPCGERLISLNVMTRIFLFQSTLPVWGATAPISGLSVGINISIHAPRVGSDAYGMDASTAYQISIHAPRVGSDPLRR